VVLHGRDDDLVTLADAGAAERLRHQVDASVALRVKITSRGSAALRKRATVTRAASNCAVARSLNAWTPRWTFAFDVS
jgi:hypothetical protein